MKFNISVENISFEQRIESIHAKKLDAYATPPLQCPPMTPATGITGYRGRGGGG